MANMRSRAFSRGQITRAELSYIMMGIDQPGGKLPLFDAHGQSVNPKIVRSCVEKGLVERWFANPMRPGWVVHRLTDRGRAILAS